MTDHLAPEASEYLERPAQVRIVERWPSLWIGYSQANAILKRLSTMRDAPKSHRPRNLLIYGTTGNGKTVILRRFAAHNPRVDDPEAEYARIPVLVIQAPAKPDEGRFYNAVLNALDCVYRPTENVARKEALAVRMMRGCALRVLVIDEIHNILSGKVDQQRFFLTVLKSLSNELQIPIIAAGTIDALRAVQAEPQLSSRFDRAHLPEWPLNPEFQRLLASFERLIPLAQPSNLASAEIATELHRMSEGIIGELSEVLLRAAVKAVTDGTERITRENLRQIDWQSPSERRRGA